MANQQSRYGVMSKYVSGGLGGGAAIPAQLASLSLWLDANDPATLFEDSSLTVEASGDGAVGGWRDKSSSLRNATQVGVDNIKPVLKLSIQNGLSVLRFASNDYLNFATGMLTTTTLFCVGKHAANANEIFIAERSTASDTPITLQLDTNASKIRGVMRDDVGNVVLPTSASTTNAVFHIYTVVRNVGALEVFTDGLSVASDTAVLGATTVTNGYIGAAWAGGGGGGLSGFLNGDICELICYDRVLANDELLTVWQYLSTKWDIALGL